MSYMFVPNFEATGHVTLVFGPENRPTSLVEKVDSIKNGLSTAKNISHGYMYYYTLSSQPTHLWPQ